MRNAWTFVKLHESITLWGLVVVMAVVLTNVTLETRHQSDINHTLIKRLDDRQNALCVAVKKGRVVFKKLVDQNGLFIGTKVNLIDCPGVNTGKPKHQ